MSSWVHFVGLIVVALAVVGPAAVAARLQQRVWQRCHFVGDIWVQRGVVSCQFLSSQCNQLIEVRERIRRQRCAFGFVVVDVEDQWRIVLQHGLKIAITGATTMSTQRRGAVRATLHTFGRGIERCCPVCRRKMKFVRLLRLVVTRLWPANSHCGDIQATVVVHRRVRCRLQSRQRMITPKNGEVERRAHEN